MDSIHRPLPLDRRAVADGFNRAAPRYEATAWLQQEIGSRLLERLPLFKIQPQFSLDLGAGTGQMGRAVAAQWPTSQILYLDFAPAMLTEARRHPAATHRAHYLTADALALPLASGSVDLVIANLSIQWCDPLELLLSEIERVLRFNGLLLFSTLGPATLYELRQSWQAIDSQPHINDFSDMPTLGNAMVGSGLRDVVLDREPITLTYPDLYSLLSEIRQIGAANHLQQRSRGLMGKTRYRQLHHHYEQWRREDGQLPATYEVIYGHAWKLAPPTATEPRPFFFNPQQIGRLR